LQPKHDLESALVRTLAPGSYSAIVRGNQWKLGGHGAGVRARPGIESKLANVSSRDFVQPGDDKAMIAGFIIGNGGESPRVVMRALGPSLAVFGFAGIP
jgi:hypothetical protein